MNANLHLSKPVLIGEIRALVVRPRVLILGEPSESIQPSIISEGWMPSVIKDIGRALKLLARAR